MEEQELLDCLSEDVSLGIELAIRQYGKAVKTICRGPSCPVTAGKISKKRYPTPSWDSGGPEKKSS